MINDFGIPYTLDIKARNGKTVCGATNLLGEGQININNTMVGS